MEYVPVLKSIILRLVDYSIDNLCLMDKKSIEISSD